MMTEYEKKVLANPELVEAMARAQKQIESGEVTTAVRRDRALENAQ